jgi:uncharacterized membrane protein
MLKFALSYLAGIVAMMVLDAVWIGAIARPLYMNGIGHLMAEQPYVPAALAFYGVYALGLMFFAVAPGGATSGWRKTLLTAAAFGFFAYATYDLSNLATLRGWPVGMSLLDMAWGCIISATAAAAAKAVLDRMARA